ncbi:MAG: hypothetical protein DLM72_09970 [Candidatus Nitrosopolaris wilkensis]|nr:MAG: hypothetical protein DLM72_09970 [Candidatus Nitrosopolaris wilkensis]
MKINQNHIRALNNKGVELKRIGKMQEAIQYFDRALETNPNDLTALKGKAADSLKQISLKTAMACN